MPARHPADGRVGNVVRRRRLADEAGNKAVARATVEMINQIFAEHTAGVGNAGRPVAGFRVEHDVRGFNAGRGKHHNFGERFEFPLAVAIDVGNTFGVAVFVDQNRADHGVEQQR